MEKEIERIITVFFIYSVLLRTNWFYSGFSLVPNHTEYDGEPVPVSDIPQKERWTQCGQLCR